MSATSSDLSSVPPPDLSTSAVEVDAAAATSTSTTPFTDFHSTASELPAAPVRAANAAQPPSHL